jgi:hypothetical protein
MENDGENAGCPIAQICWTLVIGQPPGFRLASAIVPSDFIASAI